MGYKIEEVKLGIDVVIGNYSDLYRCKIGDGCKIGGHVYIESDVIIGRNCKIKPYVFIPSGVEIADNVFIGPGVIFTNDKLPRATNPDGSLKGDGDWDPLKTYIGEGVTIGAGSVILPGIEIGKYSIIGAGSLVTKSVPDCKMAFGHPAKVIDDIPDIDKYLEVIKK